MKNFDKIMRWFGLIFFALIAVLVIIGIVCSARHTYLTEGTVTNKMFFPGYSNCTDGGCDYRAPRWIISIQNGDEFESWYVSENYYDSVHIGDWVRK